MTVYEIELKGYDGSTDETDHLIKWVATSCGDEPCLYILEELWGTNQINSVKKIPLQVFSFITQIQMGKISNEYVHGLSL
jgi:hypothetical protein